MSVSKFNLVKSYTHTQYISRVYKDKVRCQCHLYVFSVTEQYRNRKTAIEDLKDQFNCIAKSNMHRNKHIQMTHFVKTAKGRYYCAQTIFFFI